MEEKTPLRAVLFDLDGTLLDTLPDLHAAVNHALSLHGYPLRTLDQTRQAVGNGVKKLILRSLPKGVDEGEAEAVLADFRAYYAEHSTDLTHPYPGILPLLRTLTERGVAVGVVSNKYDAAVRQICAHYFPSLIDLALGEDEERGIRRKPAPDAVLSALAALGADHRSAVYVGDSEVDAMTAENAHLPCLLVSWGFRERSMLSSLRCAALLDDTDELSDYLLTALGN